LIISALSFAVVNGKALTFLDGDRYGTKTELTKRMVQRKNAGLNKVSWWGDIGVRIEIKNQYEL